MYVSGNYSNADGTAAGRVVAGTRDPADPSQLCDPRLVRKALCATPTGATFPASQDGHLTYEDLTRPIKSETYGGVMNLVWELDDLTVTSVTGYNSYSGIAANQLGSLPEFDTGSLGTGPMLIAYDLDGHGFSQELRVAGEVGNAEWMVGAYYYTDKRYARFQFDARPSGIQLIDEVGKTKTDSYAIFATSSVELSPQFTFNIGGRYTDETRKLLRNEQLVGSAAGNYPAPDAVSKEFTGDISLQWRPTSDHMIYAKVARGFKNGAFNVDPVAVGPVAAERLTSFEGGAKSVWLQGDLTTNLAIFHYDFSGFQSVVSVTGPAPDFLLRSDFINAGDVKATGIEGDLTFNPTDRWQFFFSGAWLTSDVQAREGVVGLDGNELPQAPKFQFFTSLQYRLPVAEVGDFTLRGEYRWQDETFHAIDNAIAESWGSYGVANFSIGWESEDGRLRAQAFIDNAFDKYAAKNSFYVTSGLAAYYESILPRWWGVRAGVEF